MIAFYRNLAALLLLALLSSLAHAQYSQIYVFGDSLSDNGNLRAITQNPQIPERFTNGPVAMELVAAQLGLSLTPSFHLLPPGTPGTEKRGTNFAVAGAVAIDNDGDPTTPDVNLPTQVNAFLATNGQYAPAEALYVIFIGGNDLFAAQDMLLENGLEGPVKAIERLRKANQTIEQQVRKLASAGAEHFLLVNAPDIGATPITDIKTAVAQQQAGTYLERFVADNLPATSRLLSRIFNTGLHYRAERVRYHLKVDVAEFSLFRFLDNVIGHGEQYGYTNTDDACIYLQTQGGTPNPACDFNSFVFFDEIHPTAITHQRAAGEIINRITD